jgi:hypothetical protein
MIESRGKIVGLLVLIFLLGMATGGVGYRVLEQKGYFSSHDRSATHDHKEGKEGVVKKFTRELSLSPEQAQQLNTILGESEQRYQEFYKTMRPQLEAIRQDGRNKIRAMLTETQKPKFEEMLRKMDEPRPHREESKGK